MDKIQRTLENKDLVTTQKKIIERVKKELSIIVSKQELLIGRNQTDYLYINNVRTSEDKENYYFTLIT